MSAQAPKVVLVGHCGFDASALARLVRTACPGAEISHANSDAELAKIDKTALFLVNRALDGAFSASDGVALIATNRPPGMRARSRTSRSHGSLFSGKASTSSITAKSKAW